MASAPTPSSRMRHALSPAERWNQLRRAKVPPRPSTARRLKRSRSLLVVFITLPVLIILFVFLFFANRGSRLPEVRVAYTRRLPSYRHVTRNFTAPSLNVLAADNPNDMAADRVEFFAIYRPLLFVPRRHNASGLGEGTISHVAPATLRGDHHHLLGRRSIRCNSFDGAPSHAATECVERARTLAVLDNSLSFDAILANARSGDGHGLTCSNSTILIQPLASGDSDLVNLLPRLMMTYTALQRSRHTYSLLGVPPVRAVVLVAEALHVFQMLRPGSGTIHASMAETLLTREDVDVAVVRSTRELPPACFAAGIVVGTFHRRLALPDNSMGTNGGYDGTMNRDSPLSSDALALRSLVHGKLAETSMRNKILFVLDEPGPGGALSPAASTAIRSALRGVSRREGIELKMLDVAAERLSFAAMASRFADVSVVVGVHGPVMAMSIFAPRGAGIVEIVPKREEGKRMLAGVDAAGLSYVDVRIGASTPPYDLSNVELETLIHFVTDRVHAGKENLAQELGDVVLN